MNHNLHTTKMSQTNHLKGGFNQVNTGVPKKGHISYSSRDGYIKDIEQQLMKKYRVGYSGLHKMLVIKEGQQQFGRVFV